jgi:3-oxoacyl-[acyl-carrier-protein] synthase III
VPDSIESKLGIRQRYITGDALSSADLGYEAGRAAIADAGLTPGDIDMVIVTTDTPEYISPPTAAVVQGRLGATKAGIFDLNSSCAGFTMGLTMAGNYLRCTPTARYAVVVGAVAYSRFMDPADLWFNIRFGDGAGAVVLEAVPGGRYGLRETSFVGRGQYWDYFGIYAGGAWKGFSPQALAEGYQYLKIRKNYEFNVNRKYWPMVIRRALASTHWEAAQVDRAFFTQVRRENVEWACGKFGWAPGVAYNTSEKYGYTGSACIPMAIDDAFENGALSPGDKVLICASGVGANWTAMTLVWGR